MANIFVSYARKDIELVRQIMKDIQGLGHEYWMDTRNLHSGARWTASIAEAILNCDSFLLFLSPESNASDNVAREVQIAFDNDKEIIILRLADVRPSGDLMYQLAGIHWTNYSDPDWKMQISTALGSVPTHPPEPPKPSEADRLFGQATHENLLGHAERALQLYRQVKELDPHYPGVDWEIRKIEDEIRKGQLDRSGKISMKPTITPHVGVSPFPRLVAVLGLLAVIVAALIWGRSYLAQPKPCVYADIAGTDAEAIQWLIEQESRAVRTEDMDIIRIIFADDARITDQVLRSMPRNWDNPIDRYETLFQDYQFLEAQNTNIRPVGTVEADTAYYTSGSQGSYTYKGETFTFDNADDANHWTVTKLNGCWKITKLEFNAWGIPFP